MSFLSNPRPTPAPPPPLPRKSAFYFVTLVTSDSDLRRVRKVFARLARVRACGCGTVADAEVVWFEVTSTLEDGSTLRRELAKRGATVRKVLPILRGEGKIQAKQLFLPLTA